MIGDVQEQDLGEAHPQDRVGAAGGAGKRPVQKPGDHRVDLAATAQDAAHQRAHEAAVARLQRIEPARDVGGFQHGIDRQLFARHMLQHIDGEFARGEARHGRAAGASGGRAGRTGGTGGRSLHPQGPRRREP